MNLLLRPLLCMAFSFSAFAAVAAQDPPTCTDSTIVASAFDSHGMPIKGLVAGDFRASYRGGNARVTSSRYLEKSARRVVVLLDVSGSMQGQALSNKWRVARVVASEFVSLAPQNMQVSLISFASSIGQRLDASGGRKPIADWLSQSPTPESKPSRSETALYDTTFQALRELSPAQPGDSIYIITDGGDNHSKMHFSQLERALRGSGVRLYVFLMSDVPSAVEEEVGRNDFGGLARRTGGIVANIQSDSYGPSGVEIFRYNDDIAKGIQNTTRQILSQMRNFYVLSIEEPPSAKPKDWSLEVVDADGHKRKEVGLAYSHSLTSCSQQTSQVQ